MSYKAEVENLIKNLSNVAEKRQEFAGYLNQTVQVLKQSEQKDHSTSGSLNLDQEIDDLSIAGKNLAQGRFRLMVLGDMKHGKSTLLNVLLGKDLLPRAVNPCTAILTIIRFGAAEKVTVHFKDNSTETLGFEEFSQKYTIDPTEAKRLEADKESAFPNVNYAVVEYPLPLLQNGVEIVDSPGLNDTDERNQLTLGYISSCHAIMFILNATKPCTMEERRYLENYLKGRGLTIFFLINRWDELQKAAFDPDDAVEVGNIEANQRQVFQANLQNYCQIDGNDLYQERVFETSVLNALRYRLKGLPLDGTGLPEFIGALEQFLTQERALSEFRQVRLLMRQVYQRVHEAVHLRLPLLDEDVVKLRQRVKSVEPEFHQLREIRDAFKQEIAQVREEQADAIAGSAYRFIAQLDETFEADFKPYMPDLNFFQFLWGGQRKKFEQGMQERFQKYINDRMAEWSRTAEQEIKEAFSQLSLTAKEYGAAYGNITDTINAKMTDEPIRYQTANPGERYPGWARFATGVGAFLLGDYAGLVGAGLGAFKWKGLLINLAAAIGFNAVLIGAFGVALGPIGMALVSSTAGTLQMDGVRKQFIRATRQEMKKNLPEIARHQARIVYQEVKRLFDTYGAEVSKRMSEDIAARQSELDELIERKEKGEFERETEVKRLKELENSVYTNWQALETAYEKLIE